MESNVEILNSQLEFICKYWDGEIDEREFESQRKFYITEDVDSDMQKDSFY